MGRWMMQDVRCMMGDVRLGMGNQCWGNGKFVLEGSCMQGGNLLRGGACMVDFVCRFCFVIYRHESTVCWMVAPCEPLFLGLWVAG